MKMISIAVQSQRFNRGAQMKVAPLAPHFTKPSSSISNRQTPQGIEVSPGRYVNLASNKPTHEQRIRSAIDQVMRTAKFKKHCQFCENIIYEAIENAIDYQKNPHFSYAGKKITRQTFGTTRPNNRDQEQIRMYLLAAFWRAWQIGKDEKPKVNNRKDTDTNFVHFVRQLAVHFGLGNIIKNLECFESYRKQCLLANEAVEH